MIMNQIIVEELAKRVWFYFPIGLMLLLNFVMFVFIVVYIRALDKRDKGNSTLPQGKEIKWLKGKPDYVKTCFSKASKYFKFDF